MELRETLPTSRFSQYQAAGVPSSHIAPPPSHLLPYPDHKQGSSYIPHWVWSREGFWGNIWRRGEAKINCLISYSPHMMGWSRIEGKSGILPPGLQYMYIFSLGQQTYAFTQCILHTSKPACCIQVWWEGPVPLPVLKSGSTAQNSCLLYTEVGCHPIICPRQQNVAAQPCLGMLTWTDMVSRRE